MSVLVFVVGVSILTNKLRAIGPHCNQLALQSSWWHQWTLQALLVRLLAGVEVSCSFLRHQYRPSLPLSSSLGWSVWSGREISSVRGSEGWTTILWLNVGDFSLWGESVRLRHREIDSAKSQATKSPVEVKRFALVGILLRSRRVMRRGALRFFQESREGDRITVDGKDRTARDQK